MALCHPFGIRMGLMTPHSELTAQAQIHVSLSKINQSIHEHKDGDGEPKFFRNHSKSVPFLLFFIISIHLYSTGAPEYRW